MAENSEEILIFKLRGIVTGKKAAPKAEAASAQAQTPAQAPAQAQAQQAPPVTVEKPQPAAFEVEKEAPAPFAAAEVQPVETSVRAASEETSTQAKSQRAGWRQRAEARPSDSDRNSEIERLEAIASEQYGRPMTQKPLHEATSVFAAFTGLLFIANAALFAYFIYPQSLFIVGYIMKIGVGAFMISWNYEYDIALVNLLLIAFTAFSGLMMIARIRQSHFISGIVGASLVLAVTYEYLNSGNAYLLLISVSSFICIGALAYSRMSAVSNAEREETPLEIAWPRIETF